MVAGINLRKHGDIETPMQMNFASNNVSENWRRCVHQFRVYYVTCAIGSKSAPTHVGIQLHTAGPEAKDLHETFTYTGGQQRNDIEAVLMKFRTTANHARTLFSCATNSGIVIRMKVNLLIRGY